MIIYIGKSGSGYRPELALVTTSGTKTWLYYFAHGRFSRSSIIYNMMFNRIDDIISNLPW